MPDTTPLFQEIVLIGAGNVGFHLAQALLGARHQPSWIWSRSEESAQILASEIGSKCTTDISELSQQADLYIIAVPDHKIGELVEELAGHISPDALVVHTSGATATDLIGKHFSRAGVFYPLQTFSKNREVNFQQIPICVNAEKPVDLEQLLRLGKQLSPKTYPVSDDQRLRLHLAAVFVNNFTNYMQHISQTLLSEAEIPQHLLQPLLEETVAKLNKLSATQAQTGPALRGDESTMLRHLGLLEEHPSWQEIYKVLSSGIARDLGKE